MNFSGSGKPCVTMPRPFKGLCTLLILLLVANSSQVLEAITHDSHGHESTYEMDAGTADQSGHKHHKIQAASDNPDVQNSECFCDEICCASSVGFAVPLAAGTSPQVNSPSVVPFQHYQSVSLDLLLPPPTPASL